MKIWSESELYTTTIFALNSQIIAYKTRCFTKKKEKNLYGIFFWDIYLVSLIHKPKQAWNHQLSPTYI